LIRALIKPFYYSLYDGLVLQVDCEIEAFHIFIQQERLIDIEGKVLDDIPEFVTELPLHCFRRA
jgi:hypothetical protein